MSELPPEYYGWFMEMPWKEEHDPTKIFFNLIDNKGQLVANEIINSIIDPSTSIVIFSGPAGAGKDSIITGLDYLIEHIKKINLSIVSHSELVKNLLNPGERSIDWPVEKWNLFNAGVQEALENRSEYPTERTINLGILAAEGDEEVRNRGITAVHNLAKRPDTVTIKVVGDPRIYRMSELIRGMVAETPDHDAKSLIVKLRDIFNIKIIGLAQILDDHQQGLVVKKFFAQSGSKASIEDILDLMDKKALRYASELGDPEEIINKIQVPYRFKTDLTANDLFELKKHIFLAHEELRRMGANPKKSFVVINPLLLFTEAKYIRIKLDKYR